MSNGDVNELIDQLPKIAEAVNSFQSEALQQQAFAAIMAKIGVETPTPKTPDSAEIIETAAKTVNPGGHKATRTKGRAKKSYSADKSLDLRPTDKKSFRDFANEKLPSNNDDRVTVSVYYLVEVLEVAAIGPPQILACFQNMKWRPPADIANAVQKVGSVYGWVDSKESENIKLTSGGRTAVEYDMPRAKK
jgi:hypothetical protein